MFTNFPIYLNACFLSLFTIHRHRCRLYPYMYYYPIGCHLLMCCRKICCRMISLPLLGMLFIMLLCRFVNYVGVPVSKPTLQQFSVVVHVSICNACSIFALLRHVLVFYPSLPSAAISHGVQYASFSPGSN